MKRGSEGGVTLRANGLKIRKGAMLQCLPPGYGR